MTTAEEIYKQCLHELHQEDTTNMEPDEFNIHIRKAMVELITSKYWAYEYHEKSVEDLSPIIVHTFDQTGTPISVNTDGTFTLPENLKHLLHIAFKVRFNGEKCQTDGTLSDFRNAVKVAQDEQHLLHLYYNRPRWEWPNIKYSRVGDIIIPKVGSNEPVEMAVSYIRLPDYIFFNENNPAASVNSPFKPTVNFELVRWATASYMGRIEDVRIQFINGLESRNFNQYPPANLK